MNNSYNSVVKECQNEIVINKSRFITTLIPIEDYDDAISKIKAIGKKFSDATHNCYAFISNTIATEQRFSDDGEPQGTAGMPMLEVLKKRCIYMTLAVVTRYFGGIKLGANGLVGAYSRSVAECLDKAEIVENVYSEILSLRVDYSYYKKVVGYIEEINGIVKEIIYDDKVNLIVQLRGTDNGYVRDKIIDISLGQAIITTIETKYCEYQINAR